MIKLLLLLVIPAGASANSNLNCYGVANLFGPGGQAAFLSGGEGRISLAKIFKNVPSVSFSESGFRQRLGEQQIPAIGGGARMANLEYAVELEYEGDRLKSTSQSTHEMGRPQDSLLGGSTTYEWQNGECKPAKITIKNKLLLGSASGVLFDAKLCQALKKKGLDPAKGAACVADAQSAFKVMQEYDASLRQASGDSEVLVSGQPLLPGGLALIRQANDSSYALQMMASCAEYARAPKAAPAADQPSAVKRVIGAE